MLHTMLKRLIHTGRLTVYGPGGEARTFGCAHVGDAEVAIRLRGRSTPLRLAIDPDRYLGEAYMNGDLVMERGSIADFLDLCGRNAASCTTGITGWGMLDGLRRRIPSCTRRAARRNVAHHYDLSTDFYRLFLDSDMQYSCGYFPTLGTTLEAAQRAKKNHIASKLLLRKGQRVLDIGCGWGGLALSLAQMHDVTVLGITLSREQLQVARARARALGLGDRVRFVLQDYRDVNERFDRIVSVGMFEHVGAAHYPQFFRNVSRMLDPSGIALIHAIGRMHGPSSTSRWLRKYIFPGGYIPALSEVIPVLERSKLWLTDLEVLRLHYAETLREWRERFLARRDHVLQFYDERFCRMWEFYLAASEMGFRYYGFMVFQAQLARDIRAVPLTRNYMRDDEREMPIRLPAPVVLPDHRPVEARAS